MDTDPFDKRFGAGLSSTLDQMRGLAAGFTGELTEASRAIKSLDGESKRLSRSLSSSLRSAFDKAVFGGQRLGDVFRDLASNVAGKALDAALKPVTNAISGSFTGLLGGLTGGLGSLFGFKDGAAFSAGKVKPFAKGGVVSGPTVFPMKGATGLMGEAGPEAIMPLSRGPDGKLGVASQGGGGAPVVINIQTPDVQGFQRSRSQIAAQLARAVRRGQSNL